MPKNISKFNTGNEHSQIFDRENQIQEEFKCFPQYSEIKKEHINLEYTLYILLLFIIICCIVFEAVFVYISNCAQNVKYPYLLECVSKVPFSYQNREKSFWKHNWRRKSCLSQCFHHSRKKIKVRVCKDYSCLSNSFNVRFLFIKVYDKKWKFNAVNNFGILSLKDKLEVPPRKKKGESRNE